MKNKNPYLSCMILWILTISFMLFSCVLAIVEGQLGLAIVALVLVVFDAIWLGWTICKFNDYKKFLARKKEIDKNVVDFLDWLKNENSEPFKEFEDNAKS